MPPPSPPLIVTVLSATVLSETVACPSVDAAVYKPPPESPAVLPLKVLWMNSSVPSLPVSMPG